MLAAQQLQCRGAHACSLFLTHGNIDVSATEELHGKTALHYAAEHNSLDLAKACIAVDASLLNKPDGTHMTPLMHAAAQGHVAALELMLQSSGLQANAQDVYGASCGTSADACSAQPAQPVCFAVTHPISAVQNTDAKMMLQAAQLCMWLWHTATQQPSLRSAAQHLQLTSTR